MWRHFLQNDVGIQTKNDSCLSTNLHINGNGEITRPVLY